MNIDYIKECIEYNPKTGILRWKERPKRHFKSNASFKRFNSRFSGLEAGCVCDGTAGVKYRKISIDGTDFYAHRIAWFIYYGYWPDKIDHLDGDGLNNRITNIRDSDYSMNNRNMSISKRNSTGVIGVHFDNGSKLFRAMISSKKKQRSIGSFDNIFDAAAARISAQNKLGYIRRY